MAEKKSAEDRVADLDKKIKQMQAQKRAILQREKEAARKARTKRLIRIGAEVEAYCGEITDLDAFKDYALEGFAHAPPLQYSMSAQASIPFAFRFCSQRVAFSPFFDNLRLVWSPL